MLFGNYTVFFYIAIFIIIFNLIKKFVKNRHIRNTILIAGNVLVLLTVVKEHSIIVLGILSLIIFIIGKILQKRNFKTLFIGFISFVIILFTIRNYIIIQELISHTFLSIINEPILSVQKVGISYILFRYVHWLIESYRKTIKQSDYGTFVNYILFFPTFLAGPIDQYKNFHYWIGNRNLKYHKPLFFAGVSRIFLGALKTLLIVPLIIDYALDYHLLLNNFSHLIAIILNLLCYSVYIYIDFSGYSDIAIGTAYLIGIKTPENFNNPYISKNLSEFWKRWHITFSNFLLAYVFKPFISLFNLIFSKNHRIVNTILGYLTTFTICGLWHGSTINFVYWGLWHGIGLSLNKIWIVYFKDKLIRTDNSIYNFASIALTFIYVSFGWVFFNYSHEQLIEIYNLF
ncbi:MAG: hypothetical protein K9J13_05110 [Saprospiraceae bacterium]|nr:hypothetical protein [Saprospiraceae bacterium]